LLKDSVSEWNYFLAGIKTTNWLQNLRVYCPLGLVFRGFRKGLISIPLNDKLNWRKLWIINEKRIIGVGDKLSLFIKDFIYLETSSRIEI